MSEKLYNVGMYIRLSRENSEYKGEDSHSIENQRAMLSKFISMMPGWVEKQIYIDNGASGGNFNRLGFQKMMTDIRNGEINLVLVQDLSRFGRNYLEAGKYLEDELPALGCRFVALVDGIDTESDENDIMPVINAMNDYFLKSLSDRIKSVMAAKATDGQKLTGAAPYGYLRNPSDHTRLIVDDYAADIVKRIFELRIKGVSYGKITAALNSDNILSPRLYYFTRQNRVPNETCTSYWQEQTVKSILRSEIYIGNTVQCKQERRSHRDSTQVKKPASQWVRVNRTHLPIVDESTWEAVQAINADRKKISDNRIEQQPGLFTGILFCSDCKTPMSPNIDTKHRKTGIVRYRFYNCRTYRSSGRTICSWHTISEKGLIEIVLGDVKKQAERIRLDENAMIKQLKNRLIGKASESKEETAAIRRELRSRLRNLESMTEKLYEDRLVGLVSEESFTEMLRKIETERLEKEETLAQIDNAVSNAAVKSSDIENWLRLIKQYSVSVNLDREAIESLVERIEVGERSQINGIKVQDVRIYYRFIDKV